MTKTMTVKKIIKQCEMCGESFEDTTKPKNKVTCSKECARDRKNGKARFQYRVENPYKPNQREEYYYDHLEYPFWLDDRIGRNQSWKTDVPYDPDKIEDIQRAREMEQYMGGKKRRGEAIQYNGDEKGATGVRVNIIPHRREEREVTTTKMKRADMEKYFTETYGVSI